MRNLMALIGLLSVGCGAGGASPGEEIECVGRSAVMGYQLLTCSADGCGTWRAGLEIGAGGGVCGRTGRVRFAVGGGHDLDLSGTFDPATGIVVLSTPGEIIVELEDGTVEFSRDAGRSCAADWHCVVAADVLAAP